MSRKERALLSWVAPRGVVAAAVAAVFGPALSERGFEGHTLLPLVFLLILVTVTAHGLSIGWLSRRLGLGAPGANGVLIVGAWPWTVGLAEALMEVEVPAMVVDGSWHRITRVRLAGVKAFYGDVLSEASEQRLEFNDYGYLLAATDNNAYNAHVCSYFAPEMGRTHVLQLPEAEAEMPDPRRLPRTRRGLIAMSEDALYEDLLSRWYGGWRFHKTGLTEEYTYEQFEGDLPEGSCQVMFLREGGAIQFHSPSSPTSQKRGTSSYGSGR